MATGEFKIACPHCQCFALCLATALVTNAQTHNLNTLHAIYTNAVSQIDTQYEKNLSGLLSSLKAKGDLDGYKAVKQAVENHRSGRLISGDGAGEPSVAMTDDCRKQFDNLKSQSLGQKIELQSKYIVALQELLKKLMVDDKIEAAEAVNTEIKAQTAMLADLQAERPSTESITKTPGEDEKDKRVASEPPKKTKGPALPEGAVEYNGHHYLVDGTPVTLSEARTNAKKAGGHLVTINDDKEKKFVTSIVEKTMRSREIRFPGWIWVGATRKDGGWEWDDGERYRGFL